MKHALKTLAVFSALLTATYSISGKAAEMKKASIDTIFEQGEPNPYGRFFYRTDLSDPSQCERHDLEFFLSLIHI